LSDETQAHLKVLADVSSNAGEQTWTTSSRCQLLPWTTTISVCRSPRSTSDWQLENGMLDQNGAIAAFGHTAPGTEGAGVAAAAAS
jgi:hypothetical protein